jgi:hypothetical protein
MNTPAVRLVASGLIVQRLTLGPVVDPVEDLLVPEQAVLLLEHPVVLVGEVEEARRNTNILEDVEESNTVTLGKAVVEGVVNDELGSGPVGNVVEGVPLVVSLRLPDCAVVVVADEPQLLGSPSSLGLRNTVVGHESLELVAEVVGLDPATNVSVLQRYQGVVSTYLVM